ncbi:MAG: general secretion pathway protein M [Gammaproteobacteria bacterium]|jgi:general secretion pathway protein M
MAMSQGFQRTLAVALLVLIFVLVWRGALRPAWQQWSLGAQQVEQQRDLTARLRAMAGSREQFSRALTEARAASGVDAALMDFASVTLAAARLQQDVKSLVEATGGSVVSSQPVNAPSQGPFARAQLSVRLLINGQALQRVMHTLETQRPVVLIEDIMILIRNRRRSRSRAATAVGNEMLDVRLSVVGFLARTAKEPGA